jgi:hypothetical protein
MLSAIDLDDQLGLMAGEIGDEPADRNLTPEPAADEIFATQNVP